jgi:predicted ATPase/class 3 adenylate cyclase
VDWVRKALLMTDIERSTLLWQEDPAAMAIAVARHDEIVASIIAANSGNLIKSRGEGDSTFSVFDSSSDAARAAVDLHSAIRKESWNLSRPVAVRAAINFGEIEDRAGDCYGPEVNLCARLRAVANPGQVLASGSVLRQIRAQGKEDTLDLVPLGRHRLKDLAETVDVFQISEKNAGERFGPIPSLNSAVGFLPQFGLEFLCRTSELEEVGLLLSKQNLVTMVGPGGVGKTRLAVEAARLFTQWVPDGAHFVDLSGARGGENLPGTIASSLKLRPEASVSVDALIAELAKKEALLVLDGCEHLISDLKVVVRRILQSCAGMKILVTSRSTLKLSGEQVFRLLPLSLPPTGADFEEIENAEAVRFFVSRAVMARHDFTLTSRNARPIASICGQLDGIPTALEMAAIRVRSLTPEQIVARLSSRYRLLGQSDAKGTLQALFDWSWDSLGLNEQRFAWIITVFEGSFDLEAAEAVCEQFEQAIGPPEWVGDFTGARVDPFAAIDHIDSLVEKSLLIAEPADVSMRYRLSSTFKEYALGKWPDSVPLRLLEKSHASYYCGRASDLQSELIHLEAKNLARAIEYLIALPEPEPASELVLLMTEHWQSSGLYAEGCRTMRDCLMVCLAGEHRASYSKLLNAIGLFEYYLGQFGASKSHLSEAIEIARELSDAGLRSKALNNLALVLMAEGETDGAIASIEEALPYDRSQGEPAKLAISLSNLGYLLTIKGNLDAARIALEEALQVTGRIDDRRTAIPCLVNLSDLSLEEGDLDRSANYAARGMTYAEEISDAVGAVCCQTNLGEIELRRGNLDDAESSLRRALARCIDMNAGWLMGSVLDLLAILFWRKGSLEPTTLTLVHRQVASTVPSPPRFASEANDIYAVVETEVGQETLARMKHRAEKGGVATLLDELPRLGRP